MKKRSLVHVCLCTVRSVTRKRDNVPEKLHSLLMSGGWFKICYSFVNQCLLFDSFCFLVYCCLVYIGIDCIPTFPLIVFDWAGNQTWNCMQSLISASRLKPVAYVRHMERRTRCCSNLSICLKINMTQSQMQSPCAGGLDDIQKLEGKLKDITKILGNQKPHSRRCTP